MNIVIVDDDKQDYVALKRQIERYSAENNVTNNISYFNSGINFLDKYSSADVVFMDIDMENMDGISVCRELRKKDENITIVFITNFSGYALQGYSVQAYDFLIKPVSYTLLSNLLNRLATIVADKHKGKIVTVKNKIGFHNIEISHIYYVEITGRKRIWHTSEGELYDFGLISDLEKELKEYNFARCHVSYLVNLKYVKKIKGNSVFVGDDELMISRGKNKEFMQALANYMSKRCG